MMNRCRPPGVVNSGSILRAAPRVGSSHRSTRRVAVRKSPLGHTRKCLTSTFAYVFIATCPSQQVRGVGVHFPLGHAH
jgi:hypothetical protein